MYLHYFSSNLLNKISISKFVITTPHEKLGQEAGATIRRNTVHVHRHLSLKIHRPPPPPPQFTFPPKREKQL